VVDPNSGRILSMVNQKLALGSGFTPCSTFKPVVGLAALREGIISASTKLYVGGRDRINLTDALAHSNNLFFNKLGQMLGFERITEYAQEFGLGQKAGLDIAGESAGRFPSAPPKEGGLLRHDHRSDGPANGRHRLEHRQRRHALRVAVPAHARRRSRVPPHRAPAP
jgi:hypothetical protein